MDLVYAQSLIALTFYTLVYYLFEREKITTRSI